MCPYRGSRRILVSCFMLFAVMFLSACNHSDTENMESKMTQNVEESRQEDSHLPAEKHEGQDMVENETPDWSGITENGVDEELFLKNLDVDVLETIASELQALVEEAIKEEQENPEIVLSEGFVRVFRSERYNRVIEMGDSAMKPLYFIIYKSPNAGMYEYICAMALYELSGYDFSNEDGSLSWTNSKELIEKFDEKILAERK